MNKLLCALALAICSAEALAAQPVISGLVNGPDGNPQCVAVIDRKAPHPCYDAAHGITTTALQWEINLHANGQDVRGNPLANASPPLQ